MGINPLLWRRKNKKQNKTPQITFYLIQKLKEIFKFSLGSLCMKNCALQSCEAEMLCAANPAGLGEAQCRTLQSKGTRETPAKQEPQTKPAETSVLPLIDC